MNAGQSRGPGDSPDGWSYMVNDQERPALPLWGFGRTKLDYALLFPFPRAASVLWATHFRSFRVFCPFGLCFFSRRCRLVTLIRAAQRGTNLSGVGATRPGRAKSVGGANPNPCERAL